MRQRASEAGVTRLLVIGYDEASSIRAARIAEAQGLYAAIGLHPDAAGEWNVDTAARLHGLYDTAPAKIAACGEIGLDYHWDTHPRPIQQSVFAAQIAWGRLPAPRPPACHPLPGRPKPTSWPSCVNPARSLPSSCTASPVTPPPRMPVWTRAAISASAASPRSKSQTPLRAAIAHAPLARLLLETDCPYLAPQTWRGRRNEPSYIPTIAQTVR